MNERIVAWKGEVILAAATWSDKDGHKVKFKIVGGREGPNPFKYFTKRRKGRAGTRFHGSFALLDSDKAVTTDLMLANWTDSSASGHAVEFWCDPPDDGCFHIFEGFERNKDAFMAALVELDEDEEPIDQKARAVVEEASDRRKRARSGQKLSQVAAMMCMNPDFKRWIQYEYPLVTDPAQWMRERLQIESRAELDSNDKVAFKFHEVIRKPFAEWVNRGGQPF